MGLKAHLTRATMPHKLLTRVYPRMTRCASVSLRQVRAEPELLETKSMDASRSPLRSASATRYSTLSRGAAVAICSALASVAMTLPKRAAQIQCCPAAPCPAVPDRCVWGDQYGQAFEQRGRVMRLEVRIAFATAEK
jgi:hypothetical protein